jgi:hypothetical protein
MQNFSEMLYVNMTHHRRKFHYFLCYCKVTVFMRVCVHACMLVAPLILLTFFAVLGVSFLSEMTGVTYGTDKNNGTPLPKHKTRVQ